MKLTLRQRLIGLAIMAAVVAAISLTAGTQLLGRASATQEAGKALSSASQLRLRSLKSFEEGVRFDLAYMSQTNAVRSAFGALGEAWSELVDFEEVDSARAAYTDDNPHPIGDKHLLDAADDGTLYSQRHRTLHPAMRAFLEARGYYDIFFISLDGDVIYTVSKKQDFLTDVQDGRFKNAGLGAVFRAAKTGSEGEVAFADFAPYAAGDGRPAAFVATPVFAEDAVSSQRKKVGVLAFQLPTARVSAAIISDDAATRSTAYMVGADGALRTDLSGTEASDILTRRFDAAAGRAGADIETGLGVTGQESLISFTPVSFFGEPWSLVVERPMIEVMAGSNQLLFLSVIVLAPALGLVGLVGWLQSRQIVKPVAAIDAAMTRMAEGDFTAAIPRVDGKDAIAGMARKTEQFRIAMADDAARRQANEAREEELRRERAAMMADLQQSFGAVVDRARAGDFAARVSTDFTDAELNDLAGGVNQLLETVEAGVAATGRVMARVAEGDLTERMNGAFEGAFSDLQRNVNQTVARLSDLIASIAATSSRVSGAASSIAEGTRDLSARAERQASSLEETTATMDQMSVSIKSNAAHSGDARTLASDASGRADAGGCIVRDAVSAMGEIEAGAAKIADIISVIDGIAFQTNLLALNAAVEAARAGDAGKGFAVVASEVRALAQRSSDAARDIRGLIETSASQVSNGVRLVTETGEALTGISSSIAEVEETIRNIAEASSEQANGVEEVSNAIGRMDQMTQQNSSQAEESASNARALSEGAAELQDLIAFFKIDPSVGGEDRAAREVA